MAEPFNEAAFRVAVDMWWNNPDRATTHRILTGSPAVLRMLDDARAERDRLVRLVKTLTENLEATKRQWSAQEPEGANPCDAVDEHNCHWVAGELAFNEAIRQARRIASEATR